MGVNHHNRNYDGGSPDLPLAIGDRYYAQDRARDLWYQIDQAARDAWSAIMPGFGVSDTLFLLIAGTITKGTGNTLNIPDCVGFCWYQVKIPDSFAGIPPTVKQEDVAVRVAGGAQTNMALPDATLDGVTTNYIKLRYKELDGPTRTRAKKAGTYVYERTPSYEFKVSSAAPTKYDVQLGTLVGTAGGAFTIVTYTPWAAWEPNVIRLEAAEALTAGKVAYLDDNGKAAKCRPSARWTVGAETAQEVIVTAAHFGSSIGRAAAVSPNRKKMIVLWQDNNATVYMSSYLRGRHSWRPCMLKVQLQTGTMAGAVAVEFYSDTYALLVYGTTTTITAKLFKDATGGGDWVEVNSQTFLSGDADPPCRAVRYSDTSIAVLYMDVGAPPASSLKVVTRAAEVLTVGANTMFANQRNTRVCKVGTDRMLALYRWNPGAGYTGRFQAGTLSGTTVTWSGVETDLGVDITPLGLDEVATDKVLATYNVTGTPTYCAATLSGTAITAGTPGSLPSGFSTSGYYNQVVWGFDSYAVLLGMNMTTNYKGSITLVTAKTNDDRTVSFGSVVNLYGWECNDTTYTYVFSHYVIALVDQEQLLFLMTDSLWNNAYLTLWPVDLRHDPRPLGVLRNSPSAGQQAVIQVAGRWYDTPGLTAGADYYAELDGTLTTTPKGRRIGVARTTSELLIRPMED